MVSWIEALHDSVASFDKSRKVVQKKRKSSEKRIHGAVFSAIVVE